MRDFAFVQTAPGRVFVGWGPFEQLPFRRPERPAFYVTDFFLDDAHPWRHPAQWEEMELDDLVAQLLGSSVAGSRGSVTSTTEQLSNPATGIEWQSPSF